jgi:transposase-like protein
MAQSTRPTGRTLTRIGGGSSVTLLSALPTGAANLPRVHRLSRRVRQRLQWLDYRKTHTVAQTCRHFDVARSTLRRWERRFNRHDLSTLEDRPSRPGTVRQRTWGTREIDAVLAARRQYPRWGKANSRSSSRGKGSCSRFR